MNNNWEQVKLGELTDWYSGGTPRKNIDSYWNGEIPWISASSMTDHRIYTSVTKITSEGLKSGSKLAYKDDILLLVRGSILHQKIPVGIVLNDVAYNQDVKRIKVKKNLNPWFLLYWFIGNEKKLLQHVDFTGIGAGKFDTEFLQNYLINLPPIDIQEKIVDFVKSIDEKIYSNKSISQILESIAQAIFKSWFIDFDPVLAKIAAKQEGKDPELAAMCAISGKSEAELQQMAEEDFAELQATAALFPDELVESELGEVPKGWSIQKIKDFGRVICGKTPSKSIAEYYGNDIPFIKIPDMHHDVFVLDSFEKLSEKGSNSQANKILPKGSVCVSCIATVGKVIITHQPSQTNQQINSIVPDLPIYTYFLYFLMGEKERLFNDLASGGSATLNMNTSTFSNVDILMPNLKIIEAYDGVVSKIFDEILHNLELSFLLSDMRDALLPKLLSGEIDVSGVQGMIDD